MSPATKAVGVFQAALDHAPSPRQRTCMEGATAKHGSRKVGAKVARTRFSRTPAADGGSLRPAGNRVPLRSMKPGELKRKLVDLLRSAGLRRLDEPVRLASGEWSRDFIDGKEALADYANLELACRAINEEVAARGINFDAAGGLTLGADALAVGVAAVRRGRWFFVRKGPKDRGTGRLIEGAQIERGWRVLLVDDVVTSGGSILQAYAAIVQTGAEVVAATTLVDRGEVATTRFEELNVPYFPMATYRDLGIDPIGSGAGRVSTTR